MQTMRSLALIVLFSAPLPLSAQDPAPVHEAPPRLADAARRNAVYVEFGGNALIYSMNAERFISPNVSIRGGLMLLPHLFSDHGGLITAAPLSVNGLFGKNGHYFEAGAGIVLGVGANSGAEIDFANGASATITLGYRRVRGQHLMRVGFTPVFQTRDHAPMTLRLDGRTYSFPDTGGRPWQTSFGFSLGRTF